LFSLQFQSFAFRTVNGIDRAQNMDLIWTY